MTGRTGPFLFASRFSRDAIRQEGCHQREVDYIKSKLFQKDEIITELLTEHIALKKGLGCIIKSTLVSASVRYQPVDYINHWKQRSVLRDNLYPANAGRN